MGGVVSGRSGRWAGRCAGWQRTRLAVGSGCPSRVHSANMPDDARNRVSRVKRAVYALLVVAIGAAVASCAGHRPKDQVNEGAMPRDFSLSITHNSGPDPAWYVLDVDGGLRAGLGVRTQETVLPTLVRQLTFAEMETVWRAAWESGLADGVYRLGQRGNTGAMKGEDGSVVYLSAWGARREVVVPAESELQGGVALVTQRLRSLCWVGGER